ncbi:MAG: DNA polymerase III subunit [Phycisphaeraceae bacterium]|nr:DNA polymerase III subunit [Phycisphaeraceae bacterium]
MDRILGQPAALDALRNQLATQRVHHAQVFHGPAGVGKFTTAVAFARELLCHDPITDLHGNASACGACTSCKLFDSLSGAEDSDDPTAALRSAHPDLHIVTKELALFSDDAQVRSRKLTSIPVGVIQEYLLGPASLAPALNHGKVFIVDEAELLNNTGQNALLKTLEEPTPGTYLVLVTSSEHRLLPTIRSRCQRVAFGPLDDAAVTRWLGEHHAELDEQTAKWVVGFAQGSLGRASLAVRFELVEWGTAVLSPIQRLAKSGRPEPQLGAAIGECVDGFAAAWVGAHKNASKEAANRRAASLMGSMISNYARRRMAIAAEQCDPETPGHSDQVLAPWLGVIQAVSEFERQLSSNVNLKLCCEGLGMAIHGALLGVAA